MATFEKIEKQLEYVKNEHEKAKEELKEWKGKWGERLDGLKKNRKELDEEDKREKEELEELEEELKMLKKTVQETWKLVQDYHHWLATFNKEKGNEQIA